MNLQNIPLLVRTALREEFSLEKESSAQRLPCQRFNEYAKAILFIAKSWLGKVLSELFPQRLTIASCRAHSSAMNFFVKKLTKSLSITFLKCLPTGKQSGARVAEQMLDDRVFIRHNLRKLKSPSRHWRNSGASSRTSKRSPPKSMRHKRSDKKPRRKPKHYCCPLVPTSLNLSEAGKSRMLVTFVNLHNMAIPNLRQLNPLDPVFFALPTSKIIM